MQISGRCGRDWPNNWMAQQLDSLKNLPFKPERLRLN
jgi:hypothetical protein